MEGFKSRADEAGIDLQSDALGGMFGFYFNRELPANLAGVNRSDIDRFKRFFHAMLDLGVYLAPSAYEAGFVSAAHHDAVIDATLDAASQAFLSIRN
jgi:glutamate-1-semialdehyde 2,1-aminomutase